MSCFWGISRVQVCGAKNDERFFEIVIDVGWGIWDDMGLVE